MSEDTQTHLWTPEGFQPDPWQRSETPLPGRPALLPLGAWLDAVAAADARERALLAVELLPGEPVEALLPHLAGLPLIALDFPAFTDGRSYSKAELLRRRHGYDGLLRATGEVLIDQIPLMLRMGIDQLAVSHAPTLARLAGHGPGSARRHYQPAPVPAAQFSGPFTWRRLAQQGDPS